MGEKPTPCNHESGDENSFLLLTNLTHGILIRRVKYDGFESLYLQSSKILWCYPIINFSFLYCSLQSYHSFLFIFFLVSVLCFIFDGFLSKVFALPTIAIAIVVAFSHFARAFLQRNILAKSQFSKKAFWLIHFLQISISQGDL